MKKIERLMLEEALQGVRKHRGLHREEKHSKLLNFLMQWTPFNRCEVFVSLKYFQP